MSMKCVRLINGPKGEKEIIRVRTEYAQRLVTAGKAVYVCKGIWKSWVKQQNNEQ